MNSFDHMDSEDDHVTTHIEDAYGNGYGWGSRDDYCHAPGSVNSDYGETPSDMSSPMSQ